MSNFELLKVLGTGGKIHDSGRMPSFNSVIISYQTGHAGSFIYELFLIGAKDFFIVLQRD